MREIKFRYFNKSIKQMIAIRSMYWEGNHIHINDSLHDLVHEELMQYTGLRDKNGREIYEGDILSGGKAVTWQDDGFWQDLAGGGNIPLSVAVNEMNQIVIGNIYEQPELVK